MKAYLYDIFHRCNSITDWTPTACTLALDSTQKVEGKYSIKMTSDDNTLCYMRYDRTINWSEFEDIVFSVYHPGYTNEIGRIGLYTDMLNYKVWNFDFAAEWTERSIDLSSAPDDSLGTLDLSNITFIIVREIQYDTPGEDFYFDFFRGRSIDVTSDITSIKITEEMGMPSFAELKIKGESLDHFKAGLEMEIYDSDDVLSWTGRVLYPESVMEGTKVVGKLKALGINSQFNNTYRKNFTTARDSDYVIKYIIDNGLLRFVYDDEIDDFATTYKYDLKTKVQKMLNYLSMLERAVIHYRPDGEMFFNKYDNLSKGPQIYQGIYNFEDDDVGDFPSSWLQHTATNVVVASWQGHKKVLKCTSAGGGSRYRIRQVFTAQADGDIEFYMGSTDCTNLHEFYLGKTASLTSANLATSIWVTGDVLYAIHGDGLGGSTAVNMGALTDNTLAHVRVHFDTATDKLSVWRDGTNYMDTENFINDNTFAADEIDTITLYGPDVAGATCYWDAFGYSWDANYDVGDNLKCWDETTSKIKIVNYTPNANRHITRAPIIGANNDLGQVYYVGKASDADEQKYGINQLQPWRDSEITNYAEAKQLGDNLLAIYSIDTQMISMLVVGKGHLQVAKTLNIGWAGVFSITQKDFLLTKRIWYPMNDICEIELTDNILTRKAFNVRVINKFYDEDAQQSYEEPDVPESTEDGTVQPLVSVAELRARLFLDEDDMVSDDPKAWATQQSIRKYVDDSTSLHTWVVGVNMTRDAAWHDVDMSGMYGATTLGVLLQIKTLDDAVGQKVQIRPKDSGTFKFMVHNVANKETVTMMFTQTDSNGIWQYLASAVLTAAEYTIFLVIKE